MIYGQIILYNGVTKQGILVMWLSTGMCLFFTHKHKPEWLNNSTKKMLVNGHSYDYEHDQLYVLI